MPTAAQELSVPGFHEMADFYFFRQLAKRCLLGHREPRAPPPFDLIDKVHPFQSAILVRICGGDEPRPPPSVAERVTILEGLLDRSGPNVVGQH